MSTVCRYISLMGLGLVSWLLGALLQLLPARVCTVLYYNVL